MIEAFPIFSVPVARISTDRNNSSEIQTIKEISFCDGEENLLSKNTSLLELEAFKDLKGFCQTQLNEFVNNIINCEQDFYITNSWVAKTSPGSSHHIHKHPNSIISAVYYLDLEKPTSEIIFYHKSSIRQDFGFTYNIKEYNIFNSDKWALPVKNGDMIFFPSWLDHGVNTNVGGKDRIILGFNTFVKGTFGSDIYSADLNL